MILVNRFLSLGILIDGLLRHFDGVENRIAGFISGSQQIKSWFVLVRNQAGFFLLPARSICPGGLFLFFAQVHQGEFLSFPLASSCSYSAALGLLSGQGFASLRFAASRP